MERYFRVIRPERLPSRESKRVAKSALSITNSTRRPLEDEDDDEYEHDYAAPPSS